MPYARNRRRNHPLYSLRMFPVWRRGLLVLGCTLLGACQHTPGPGDIPPGTEFTTRIFKDGTKLFVLKVHGRGGGGGPMAPDADFGGGPGTGGDDMGRAQPSGRGDSVRDLRVVATAMLAENKYCRTGFLVLEQFRQDGAQVLRGECREAADAADRERFTH